MPRDMLNGLIGAACIAVAVATGLTMPVVLPHMSAKDFFWLPLALTWALLLPADWPADA